MKSLSLGPGAVDQTATVPVVAASTGVGDFADVPTACAFCWIVPLALLAAAVAAEAVASQVGGAGPLPAVVRAHAAAVAIALPP